MKKRIARVSVMHNAKVAAAIYFVISLPMAAVIGLATMVSGGGPGLGAMMFFPLMYLICGFVFTVVAAWVYNFVAAQLGGVEFTSVEVAE